MPNQHRTEQISGYLVIILLLLICTGMRWTRLLDLPLFIDEATGINRARDVLIGFPFAGLKHDKWLPPVIWSLFRPFGPETLWLTRAVTGLITTLTCAATIGLGRAADRRLGTRGVGILAGLLYLVLPLSVFFDRQALADPLLAVFTAMLLVAALRLALHPTPLHTIITGLALALAILTKFTGFVLVPVTVLTAFLMAPRRLRWRSATAAIIATLLAGALVLAVLIIADRYLDPYDSPLRQRFVTSSSNLDDLTDLTFTPDALRARWGQVGREMAGNLLFFFTWPLAAAGLASLAWFALSGRCRRTIGWIWLAGLGPMLPLLVVGTWLPARYMGFVAVPVVLLAAIAALSLPRRWLRLALGALLIAWPLPRAWTLLMNPAGAHLPSEIDRSYYVEGTNLAGVRADLLGYADEHPGPVHLVYDGVSLMSLQVYWGGQAGSLRAWDGSVNEQAEVARWLLAGESAAYLDTGEMPVRPDDTFTETIGTYPGPQGQTYRLRIVTGPGLEMLRVMYNQAFGNPLALEADYAVLAGQLADANQAVILYPPHQAAALAGSFDVVPLETGWPLDIEAARRTLRETADEHQLVSVVFFNETAGDPQRALETWLNQNLFRLSERWVGALRVLEYASEPPGWHSLPLGVTFGDLMTLEAANVISATIDGDQIVYIGLDWHADRPIERSYKIAAHIVGPGGEVVAQHDGVPMGYLAPTDTWLPGQPVVDRFALRLPGDIAPGLYEVRIIVYDEVERLRLTEIDGSPEFVMIGAFTVGP